MDNTTLNGVIKDAVKPKFRGKKEITAKVVPRYQEGSQREYQRVTNAYMRILNKILKEHLPAIIDCYKKAMVRKDSRFDSDDDFANNAAQEFNKVRNELNKQLKKYGLEKFIEKTGTLAQSRSVAEWKRIVKQTLGINLLDDYYNGEKFNRLLKQWINDNVKMVKSVPTETLDSIEHIVYDSFMKGVTVRDLQKQIQKEYGLEKHRAALIARDQMAKLNSNITRMQQEDAGVTKYKWLSSHDERVRDCHAALNGQIFSWDNPPEMWYTTKKSGTVYTGRRCHPGEDYCCRCVAIPVFDIDTLDMPVDFDK